MRIGIDVSTWSNGRGFGRFTRELVTAMTAARSAHEFVLFCDQPIDAVLDARIIRINPSRPVTQAAVADGSRGAADVLRFTLAAARARLDVMFYPAVYSWFPCPPGLRNVLTLHDAIAEHFPHMVFPRARARALWNLKVRLACWQASRFLTVSQAAKREIVTYMKLDGARIDVTTEGPKPGFGPPDSRAHAAALARDIRSRYDLPPDTRHFCYVGGFAPHKNVSGVVRAFAQLDAPAHRDIHLLLVGDRSSQGFSSNVDELDALIGSIPALAGRVHFTGYVDDESLAAIYATAIALVMPSFSEGFGLPAVEAMACGTPVVASTQGSLPEVVGPAGILVDPHEIGQIAAAMNELACRPDHAAALGKLAGERAALFTWNKAAALALECIERGGGRGPR